MDEEPSCRRVGSRGEEWLRLFVSKVVEETVLSETTWSIVVIAVHIAKTNNDTLLLIMKFDSQYRI